MHFQGSGLLYESYHLCCVLLWLLSLLLAVIKDESHLDKFQSLFKCLNFNVSNLELEFYLIKTLTTYHALDRCLLFHHKRFSNFKCHNAFYSLCLKDPDITSKFHHETSPSSCHFIFPDFGVKGIQKNPKISKFTKFHDSTLGLC